MYHGTVLRYYGTMSQAVRLMTQSSLGVIRSYGIPVKNVDSKVIQYNSIVVEDKYRFRLVPSDALDDYLVY